MRSYSLPAMLLAISILTAAASIHCARSSADSFALCFLDQVAGLDLHTYAVASYNTYDISRSSDSPRFSLTRIVLSNGTHHYEASLTSLGDKLLLYNLALVKGTIEACEQTPDYYYSKVRQHVDKYVARLNLSYCGEFSQMVSYALRTNSLVVENESSRLEVSFDHNGSRPMEYARFQWFQKMAGQYTTHLLSVCMALSKDGLLTGLTDNMRLYHLGSEEIKVTKERAINISRQYIDAYAQEHQQQVEKVEASLEFSLNFVRDKYTLFPGWKVSALYDRLNEENVNQYVVYVWADNGEENGHGPVMWMGNQNRADDSSSLWPLAIVATVFAVVFSLNLGAKPPARHKCNKLCLSNRRP